MRVADDGERARRRVDRVDRRLEPSGRAGTTTASVFTTGASRSTDCRAELGQKLVQALHERGRILELAALGQHGLLEQKQRQALEPALVGLVLEPANERVLRVQLETRDRGRRLVARGRSSSRI